MGRYAWLLTGTLTLSLACRPHRAADPLELANTGAVFDVRLNGCTTTDPVGRRFGTNIRTALLWSSEVVHTASYLPCTATIEAVRDGQRRTVYRFSRSRDGAYVETLVHDPWAADSSRLRIRPE